MRRLQRVNVRVRGRPAALKVLAAHQARVHVVRDERDAAALLEVEVEQRAVHGVEVRHSRLDPAARSSRSAARRAASRASSSSSSGSFSSSAASAAAAAARASTSSRAPGAAAAARRRRDPRHPRRSAARRHARGGAGDGGAAGLGPAGAPAWARGAGRARVPARASAREVPRGGPESLFARFPPDGDLGGHGFRRGLRGLGIALALLALPSRRARGLALGDGSRVDVRGDFLPFSALPFDCLGLFVLRDLGSRPSSFSASTAVRRRATRSALRPATSKAALLERVLELRHRELGEVVRQRWRHPARSCDCPTASVPR